MLLTLFSMTLFAQALPVDYDIVYVRWPRTAGVAPELPQGEDMYRVEPGADLVLLKRDGSEVVLVDCTTCCVQDPMLSFDGNWVYYTKMLDATDVLSPSLLFKIRTDGQGGEIQLTFDDGFRTANHQGNDELTDDLGNYFSIRDMGPAPMPDGRIVFTSNRNGLIGFIQGTNRNLAWVPESGVAQLFVIDDHGGELTSGELANLRQLEYGNLRMALHPFMLKDGRILYTNWEPVGRKFLYAMSTLFAVNPDGSALRAITEPHDHHKNVDHFATQLTSGHVIHGQYYPRNNFGYGILARFPIDVGPVEYTADPVDQANTYNGWGTSYRNFDRKEWVSLTTHTDPGDCEAPNDSGKYAMPAAAPNNALLTAYSPGKVNWFDACGGIETLRSGIYLVPADIAETGFVTDPNQLVPILNSDTYNEIWPRPVVSYQSIYGQPQPDRINPVDPLLPDDSRLQPAEPSAIVGTSSLYNRESAPLGGDPFEQSGSREIAAGNWLIQGADSGLIADEDIYAVRIVGVVPKPFRRPIDRWDPATVDAWNAVSHLLMDPRMDSIVDGYAATHQERWKIIAEIPVRKRNAQGQVVLDQAGNPDTSFAAKVPAHTPFFFQGIDENGMTLFSEMTWRGTVPGEVRTDCGGCHAHSIEPFPYRGTASWRRDPLAVNGLADSDPMIANGLWDVIEKTPLLTRDAQNQPAIQVEDKGMIDVEYHRDILPILQNRCVGCHHSDQSDTSLVLDGTGPLDDPYFRLVRDTNATFGPTPPNGSNYRYPQLTRYIRAMQSRQSLLVWKLMGSRLDGRSNDTRPGDLDFEPHGPAHNATPAEIRTIARWIDLGCAVDFPGEVHAGYRYTDDNLLPVVHIASPKPGHQARFDGVLKVGLVDVESGIDWDSLQIEIDTDPFTGPGLQPVSTDGIDVTDDPTVIERQWEDLPRNQDILLAVTVRDRAGNRNRATVRFSFETLAQGCFNPRDLWPLLPQWSSSEASVLDLARLVSCL
ncbi:HZS-alpha domain-containing protein [Sulfidibacter corallicola]|uniref:Hydrazine synthase alpha subunit middle domain-containing protein n=1 Tax=Sulfidibacter corallicola TaxID=2818388 RepID=A0A8A4TMG0_SULCO|nr:hypothetical protein [Sulfidibacter corallicola]QTD50292.1 hypothetical protein J3U87_32305 [Sulfidibacter corallicola]